MKDNHSDISSVDRVIQCERKGKSDSFMLCPLCEYYPCQQLTEQDIYKLNVSPLMDRKVIKLKPRRCKLYIIKYLDGTLKEAPNLDPAHPERELMQNVETVYQVGKELVPVVVLKPKPRDERKKVSPKQTSTSKNKKTTA